MDSSEGDIQWTWTNLEPILDEKIDILNEFGLLFYRYLIYNRLAQKIFWAIYQSLPGRLNAFIEILFCNLGLDTPNKVTSQSQQQLLDQ